MIKSTPKKAVKTAGPFNPVLAGIAGAVVGGAAVAASIFIGDKNNRRHVKNIFADKKLEVKEKVIKEVKKI